MRRGKKKATGFLTWVVLLIGVVVMVQMFSTKKPNQQQQAIIPAPAIQTPAPVLASVPHVPAPALPSPASKEKLAKHSPPDPDAKKPSTPRSRVLFTCGRNLEKAHKKDGAIYFYREVLMECRGTPESDQAISRLKFLGGTVPDLAESITPKEGDPFTPPKVRPRHHYASSKAARQAFDQMLSQEIQSVMNGGNGQGSQRGTPGAGGHRCGALTLAGTPCQNLVAGSGCCHLHQ
jgi:hypothetical protein